MIKDSILNIVTDMIEKKKGKIEPEYILFSELLKEVNTRVKGALNELYADGKIRVGNSLNDKYIEVI